jgi:hypothetical protein
MIYVNGVVDHVWNNEITLETYNIENTRVVSQGMVCAHADVLSMQNCQLIPFENWS